MENAPSLSVVDINLFVLSAKAINCTVALSKAFPFSSMTVPAMVPFWASSEQWIKVKNSSQ
jgi:hypothetical protein